MSDRDTNPKMPIRPNIKPEAYRLRGQLSAMVDGANDDPDAVSMIELGESETNLEGAIVVIKGDQPIRDFEAWAIQQGHLTRGARTQMQRAFRDDESVRKGPNSWVSPPVVCPCPDPDHVERCVEVGCRHHPAASLRCFLFANRAVMRCSQCMAAVFVVAKPGPVSQCANSAGKSSNSN